MGAKDAALRLKGVYDTLDSVDSPKPDEGLWYFEYKAAVVTSKRRVQAIRDLKAAASYCFKAANTLFGLAAREFDYHGSTEEARLAYDRMGDAETRSDELRVLTNPPLQSALERIRKPGNSTHLEHHVASWAVTSIVQVFEKEKNDRGVPQWVYTSEQRDEDSGKIPDFAVEKVQGESNLTPWLYMEFKKVGGHPTYKALHQLSSAVKNKLRVRSNWDDVLTIFLVVVAGTRVSFWEIDFEALDGMEPEAEVHSLWGCRSLTQTAHPYEEVMGDGGNVEPPYTTGKRNIPGGVEELVRDREMSGDDPKINEALGYDTPCIFDCSKEHHKGPIREMFEFMARHAPRGF